MREYPREENVNTPEFWDRAYRRDPDPRHGSAPIYDRVIELLDGLGGDTRVYEYGFGSPVLGRRLGERWEGRDFSPVAVENARAEGLSARVERCGDSPGFRKSYIAAIEVLEHLDHGEMIEFLERSKHAPHAFISVPAPSLPDADFKQHLRSFGGEAMFADFLRTWWPYVHVETINHRMLAHCSTRAPTAPPLLTIGCSTLLDFHGFQYTAASWNQHHGDFGGRVELVLVDNHPEPTTRLKGCGTCAELSEGDHCSLCAHHLEQMEMIARKEGVRYIRWSEKQGTYPGKNRLKVEARGKWVLTMDSHVMLSPGTVATVLDTIDANPESEDFYHFPCQFWGDRGKASVDYRNLDYIYRGGTKQERGGVYGWTRQATTPGEPYPIAAMITSCYLVRRQTWRDIGGYDPILGNYGGWEGPLQLKFWMTGRRVLSLRHPTQERMDRDPQGFLHHWHLFNKAKTEPVLSNATGRVHTGRTKQRNFAASSAVLGGEAWVREHCALKGWDFGAANIQEGMRAGLELRPWFVSQLADPAWEDIDKFFVWMRAQEIPGAMR